MLRNATKLPSMMVRGISLSHRRSKLCEISSESDYVDKVIHSSVPVIVNFHADWCGPCKILTPKLIELIEPMDELSLAIVDLDLNPDFASIFNVKAVPAIVAYSSGLIVERIVGFNDMDVIDNLIHKLTEKPPSNIEERDDKKDEKKEI